MFHDDFPDEVANLYKSVSFTMSSAKKHHFSADLRQEAL